MVHLTKKLVLAASVAALVAAPASARGGWNDRGRGHDGIDAGDVIAGALVIGGIAAIASASSDRRADRGGRYGYGDDRGYGYRNNGYGSRSAVDQCVRAAQRQASRYGWARVTDVTSIDRVRGGYEVRGRLVVENDRYRGRWNGAQDRYGTRYDRYGNDYDKGRFNCVAGYGGGVDVRLAGLRGGW